MTLDQRRLGESLKSATCMAWAFQNKRKQLLFDWLEKNKQSGTHVELIMRKAVKVLYVGDKLLWGRKYLMGK